ncbi:MAG: cyclic nucleotide-binding domain-containing protein [Planctomyces sp.]
MRKVLYILGSLSDTDVDWLVSSGRAVVLPAGMPLIEEGKHLDALFIVLEGSLGITVAAMPGKILATAGPGEVLGEISMLDSRPPLATVTAETDCRILRIPRTSLDEKLRKDSGFGSRFYRTLAVFLAQRMRDRTAAAQGQQNSLKEDVEGADEIDPELLEEIALAGKRFEWILKRMNDR